MSEFENAFEEWLKDRPKEIQSLARKFPPNSVVDLPDGRYWVISYNESDPEPFLGLVRATKRNRNYENAVKAKRIYVCPSHFEQEG